MPMKRTPLRPKPCKQPFCGSVYRDYRAYIEAPAELPYVYDVVLVDGRARPQCAVFIIPYLRNENSLGGWFKSLFLLSRPQQSFIASQLSFMTGTSASATSRFSTCLTLWRSRFVYSSSSMTFTHRTTFRSRARRLVGVVLLCCAPSSLSARWTTRTGGFSSRALWRRVCLSDQHLC